MTVTVMKSKEHITKKCSKLDIVLISNDNDKSRLTDSKLANATSTTQSVETGENLFRTGFTNKFLLYKSKLITHFSYEGTNY